jgi:hypothetical protein
VSTTAATQPSAAQEHGQGTGFNVRRLALDRLRGFVGPVVGFDDFRMKQTTFAPHPHAGFAALTYIYEDSTSGMRDRDSLGNDVIAGPGDLLCTVAGRGVIHDELPSVEGREVNGLQLFINLHSKHKQISPGLIHVKANDVPLHTDSSGNRARILAGKFGRKQGTLKLPEPACSWMFDWLPNLSSPFSRDGMPWCMRYEGQRKRRSAKSVARCRKRRQSESAPRMKGSG